MFDIMEIISIIFACAVIISLLAVILAKRSAQYTDNLQLSRWYRLRTIATISLGIGFVTHTFGDLMYARYGPGVENLIEGISHVIIMFALLLLGYVSKITWKITEKLGA